MRTSITSLFHGLVLTGLVCCGSASAGETSLIVNGKSYHINSSHDWNENNVGLGLEYQFEQRSAWRKTLLANAFLDSTDNMSYMAGAGLHRRLYESAGKSGFHVYAGLNVFLMHRDDLAERQVFPGVLPSLAIGTRRFGFNLTYLPREAVQEVTQAEIVDPTISGIVFVQFKWRLQPRSGPR